MSYIGQGLPSDVFAGFTIDKFTGTGVASQTLTLTKAPLGETALLVTIDGVVQEPTDDFTVSGTTVTIVGTAPLNSEINVTHLSGTVPNTLASAVDVNGLSDGIILDADADTTISADTDDQIDFKTGGTDRLTIQSTSGNNVVVADGLTLTDGNLVVASGHGIDFSATSDGTTMSSELFDDYEEGIYTATIVGNNSGSYTMSSGSNQLQYTKIGRKVTTQGMLSITGDSSADGAIKISLPFTAPSLQDDTDYSVYSMGLANQGSTIAGNHFLFVQAGSYAFMYAIGDDGATNYIGHDELDTSWQVHVNLTYVVE